jgi:glycerol-3-phosphate acyltransferase PlsY
MTLVPYSGIVIADLVRALPLLLAAFALSYLIGSVPSAYFIVKAVTGEDVTAHGTGNVGAMNVRRSTGSWTWFVVAMFADLLKGFLPLLAAELLTPSLSVLAVPLGTSVPAPFLGHSVLAQAVLAGAVLGHNYSLWMALISKRFTQTGKGLATGAGALLAYDWRYFAAVVLIGLTVIAITRYMMAGQVAAAATLPSAALALRQSDWPFALLMGLIVYWAHHKRFVGLLRGAEPRLYVEDRMGPRG